jgi:hypothetical protein
MKNKKVKTNAVISEVLQHRNKECNVFEVSPSCTPLSEEEIVYDVLLDLFQISLVGGGQYLCESYTDNPNDWGLSFVDIFHKGEIVTLNHDRVSYIEKVKLVFIKEEVTAWKKAGNRTINRNSKFYKLSIYTLHHDAEIKTTSNCFSSGKNKGARHIFSTEIEECK